MTKTPMATRFWRRVVRGPEAQCWLWVGYKNTDGYGVLGDGHKNIKAHRASWIIHRGAIPDGLGVLHRCDVPACINPAHLFLGTQLDNSRDMLAKGRLPSRRGERNSRARLTAQDVIDIRRRRAAGETYKRLAAAYGVAHSTITSLVSRQNWSHVEAK